MKIRKRTVVGLCMECMKPIFKEDELVSDVSEFFNHPGLYECSYCGHPQAEGEIQLFIPEHLSYLRYKEGYFKNRKRRALFSIRWKHAVINNKFY